MSKARTGAGKAPAPKRGAGIHLHPQVLVRLPQFALELVNEAAEHSNCDNRAEWLRTSLILQAAEELGLDPVAALSGQRKPPP